jgi:TNF receptor-associated protein 1
VNLEINPRHAVIKRLFATHTAVPEKAKLVAEQMLDNALISAGLLDDPTPMVARSTSCWRTSDNSSQID